MYTYVKSLVLARKVAAQWEEAQLGDTPVVDIFQQFSEIIHVVTNPLYPDEVYVDFTELKQSYANVTDTLLDWFVSIDDMALPLLPELPTSNVRYIQYMDANQAGYVAKLAKIGSSYPEQYPRNELPDIALTRLQSTTDVTEIHTKALVTVNGFLHITNTDATNLFVKDAAKSSRVAQEVCLGLISFANLATIEKMVITDAMIFPEVAGRPLYERADIKLNSLIGNKTILLSIGGYLFLPEEGVCWQTGDDTISICLERTPFIDRFYESKRYINMDSLELTPDQDNPDAVSLDELKSDVVLRKYLTLSQSFIILVDTPNLFHRKLYIERMAVPSVFTTQQEPTYPLITGYGKMSEYWKRYEDGYWAMNVTDGHMNNHLLDYRSQLDIDVINAQRFPNRTYTRSKGYLLEIGSYI